MKYITKPSKLLREAKKNLDIDRSYGKEKYICLAVRKVWENEWVDLRAYQTVRNRINDLLVEYMHLEDGVVIKGHVTIEEVTSKKNQKKLLRPRRKCIDHMVAEYEAQGHTHEEAQELAFEITKMGA